MSVPVVTDYLKYRKRRKLRHVMRGYRILRESGQLGKIGEVKEALTNTALDSSSRLASSVLYGAGIGTAEYILRQYLMARIGGLNFNSALLYSLGNDGKGVTYPLPREWRSVLRQQGFKVSGIRSALAWQGFVALLNAYGTFTIFRIFAQGIVEKFRGSFPALGQYAYFVALQSGNLPRPVSRGVTHDIVTWYEQWPGRVSGIDAMCHSVKATASQKVKGIPVVYVPAALPPLTRFSELVRFTGWSVAAISIAMVDLLRGRWVNPFLLNQAAIAAQARILPSDKLAAEYLFHNSGWVYRPLWSYEAEKSGALVSLYFYSTNVDPLRKNGQHLPYLNSWQIATWPRYLVWDRYQAEFIDSAVGAGSNVSIVGPIWFQDSGAEIPELPGKTVALFDVQPFRNSIYTTLGIDTEYYTAETAIRFIDDIYTLLEYRGMAGAHKRKRDTGKAAHPRYRYYLSQAVNRSNLITIDPDISALALIDKCVAVISMPYTSTALLGQAEGKPSVYYDPFGAIDAKYGGSHGIELISGKEQLGRWLDMVLDSSAGRDVINS